MAMAMELSSDLVEEILSWVPARCLARLKYTCKQWETLIAEPRFAKKHLSHMRGREQQFTVFNNVSQFDFSCSSTVSCAGIDFNELNKPSLNMQVFEPLPPPTLLVNDMCHCDGLLLFVMRTNLLVLNPLLKQARWINCGYGFQNCTPAYGFGYTSSQSSGHCDYKIVRFICGVSDKNSKIEVYEFKTDCWRVIVDKSFDGFSNLPESSVCLRGTPYWIGYLNGKNFSMIQSFDFSKERFEPLFLPPSSIGSLNLENSLSLGIFRGDKLSLLHSSGLTGKIHLWVKKEHWSKLMTFTTPQFLVFSRYSSYFIENNGKLVLSFNGLCSYIVGKDDECRVVTYYDMIRRSLSSGGSACYYVPSLLQVPGFSEAKRVGYN